jgi:hypothetical protein
MAGDQRIVHDKFEYIGFEKEYLALRSIPQLFQRTRTHLIPLLLRNPPKQKVLAPIKKQKQG